jgi:hypothetical protein
MGAYMTQLCIVRFVVNLSRRIEFSMHGQAAHAQEAGVLRSKKDWKRFSGWIGALLLLVSATACGLNAPGVATQVLALPTVPTNTLAPLITMTPRFTATPIPTSTLIPTATLPATATPAEPTASATPSPVPIIQVRGSVNDETRTVNLRRGPGRDFETVESVSGGTELTVIGVDQTGGWYFVVLEDGTEGWMAGEFVTVASPTSVAVLSTADLTRRAVEPGDVTVEGTVVATVAPRRPQRNDVLAYCDLPAFRATDGGKVLSAGDSVNIWWSWLAATPEQIQDHLDYSRYAVNVERLEDETWTMFRDLDNYAAYQTGVGRWSGNYAVYWYVPVGALEAGEYRVNYRVTWTQQVDDGEKTFGPGGDEELNSGTCAFEVR